MCTLNDTPFGTTNPKLRALESPEHCTRIRNPGVPQGQRCVVECSGLSPFAHSSGERGLQRTPSVLNGTKLGKHWPDEYPICEPTQGDVDYLGQVARYVTKG
jgi:hypothetical protein